MNTFFVFKISIILLAWRVNDNVLVMVDGKKRGDISLSSRNLLDALNSHRSFAPTYSLVVSVVAFKKAPV